MKKMSKLVSCIAGLTLFFTAILPAHALYLFEIELILPIITHPIYVNDATGNDTDPGTTPGEALKTITEAVDRANTGGYDNYQILISEGDYTTETYPWSFNKDISLYGGYYNSFSSRDAVNHESSVRGGGDTIIEMYDKSGVISGLNFYNQTGGNATIYIDNNGGDNDSVTVNGIEINGATAVFGGIYAVLEPGDNFNAYGNYIHDLTSFGSGVYIEGNPNTSHVYNNLFYTNSLLNGSVSAENTIIYNNIISGTTSGPGIQLGDNAKAYHNTVVDNNVGIKVGSTISNAEFKNNLIAHNSNEGAEINSGSTTYDYNAYFDNGAAHTVATHEVNCDPLLTDYNSTNPNDYQLGDGSLCIDTGTEVSEVISDYFGNERKKDGNADAVYASDPGAHEADGDEAAAPAVSGATASPNVFSPDGDAVNDTTTISFNLNVTSNVIVAIYDGSTIVKQLINEVRSSGTHNVVWDGTDDASDVLPEGDYTYQINAQNSEGTDEVTGTVTIDMGAVSTECSGYPDVSFDDPLCPAITYVTDQGIFQGYPDGSFRPNDVINRVETTKVILEGFNVPLLPDDGTNLGFSDVIIGEWYMTYLRSGQEEGIIQGYPDGTFRPNQQVNRVEMLKIFMETSGEDLSSITITTDPYPDTPIATDTSWYLPYVQFSKDYALIDPDSSGNFNPAEGMKRGDVAELFYRFHQEGFI